MTKLCPNDDYRNSPLSYTIMDCYRKVILLQPFLTINGLRVNRLFKTRIIESN